MIGLLFKVAVGVVATAAVVGGAYAVYKYVTKDSLKKEITNEINLEDEEIIKKAFAARVREKSPNSVKVSILDEMDEPITEVSIDGDEISEDIHVGDIIELRETS